MRSFSSASAVPAVWKTISPPDKLADIAILLDPKLTPAPEPTYPINAASECLVYKTPQL